MKMNLDGAFLKVELPTNFLVREAKGSSTISRSRGVNTSL
jgi:hypothetical protein